MTIFENYLKRILRSKLNLFIMAIFPVILIAVVLQLAKGAQVMTVAVVDNDQTNFSGMIIEKTDEKANIVYVEEKNIKQGLLNNDFSCAIVIEEGFTEKLIANKSPKLKVFSLEETNASKPLKININSFLNTAGNLAAASNGDESRFYNGLKAYRQGSLKIKTKKINEDKIVIDEITAGLGFLIMSMLFLSFFAANTLLNDRESKLFHRIMAGPVTQRTFMMETILCFLVIMVLQVAFILFIMNCVLNIYMGTFLNVFKLFGVLLVFSVLCVSFGICMSSIAKNVKQATILATLLITPMCMLGGCYWPREFMPKALRVLSNFVPTSWALEASKKVLSGAEFTKVAGDLGILLLFTLILFLLGTWRKVDMAG